jgi:SAM-dependent methyltransferase
MSGFIEWLDKRFYPNVREHWDDTLFREFVLRRLTPTSTVLDLGAGAGILPQLNFKGFAARVCGVDPDPRVLTNPYLDEAKVGLGSDIPYGDAAFDIVIADNVLEHLEQPVRVFGEVSRVLKPGGYFLAKTPNKSHYVPLISRATPHAFHRFYNRLRGRDPEDTFPTHYRANSPRQIRSLAATASLEMVGLHLVESRPEYLRLNVVSYLCGILYERTVNLVPQLSELRVIIIAELMKKK